MSSAVRGRRCPWGPGEGDMPEDDDVPVPLLEIVVGALIADDGSEEVPDGPDQDDKDP